MSAVNEAEAFVHGLCRRSFLSVWSVENPAGPKKGNELADAVVVVGEDVVVISVKERNVKPSGDRELDARRWYRDAVVESVQQLRGTRRALDRMPGVARLDNPDVRLRLPSAERRRVHFVAVALGGKALVPVSAQRHDFGLVHVFDRTTFEVLLRELDTITDFLDYLRAKEELLGHADVVLEDGEWDLLAVYLREGRRFPPEVGGLFLTAGLWKGLTEEPAFQRRKAAEEVSYSWDHLIEEFAKHLRGGTLLGGAAPSQTELGLRYMVREKRFHRRLLGERFVGFLRKAGENQAQSRVVPSPTGVVYILVVCPRDTDAKTRGAVLIGYCSIVREAYPDAAAVVGVLTERPDGDWRLSFGMLALDGPVDDEIRAYAQDARDAGILARQVRYGGVLHEYPDAEDEDR